MDTSKAAAALGRLGGKAGRGEVKRRGDSSHYRAIRAKRPAPQTFEARSDWGGYEVREGLKGWVVSAWSARSGERTGWRCRVDYSAVFPQTTVLSAPVSDYPGAVTEGETIYDAARREIAAGTQSYQTQYGGVRVLSRGHVVR